MDLRGVRYRRAVIPRARRDHLVNAAALCVDRERVQRAAHLERAGRQLGFELEKQISGRCRRSNQARGPDVGAQNRRRVAVAISH